MNKISILLLPLLFTGCMCLPMARGDLSVLGDDIFSDIIKASYSENYDGMKGYVNGLDVLRANRLSRDILIGKNIHDVMLLFEQQKGECHEKVENRYLRECSINKKWKLENIGAKMDTSNWSDPAVKMDFKFEIDSNRCIQSLKLEVIDITQYKQIMTK